MEEAWELAVVSEAGGLTDLDWIVVEDSNFAKSGLSVHFSDSHIVCSRGPEAGLKIDAADIVFLNDPPRSKKVSNNTGTNLFFNHFVGGAYIAIFLEFFGFVSSRKKKTRKIIARFKDDRFLIGKTDLDTFFAIQNAWLDRR
ncbi:MAG: hypothetical protein ABJN22_13155 [Litorimonas sp.]